MPTNYTTNYQLNQWEPTDQVLRTDFNADNAKLEAALSNLAEGLAGKAAQTALDTLSGELDAETAARTALAGTVPKIVWGGYTGDGTTDRVISLGFAPKAVLLCTASGTFSYQTYRYGGLAYTGAPIEMYGYTLLAVTNTGFQVTCVAADSGRVYSNYNNEKYRYLAFA